MFLLAVVTLQPLAVYSGAEQPILVLTALLVCLIPTTIGALLSAIGIAGMDRLVQHNVLAMSGRAVEAAGDVNTLLLDKTGTITLGNRQAASFDPVGGVAAEELADAAQLSSLADETPEGRSIVVLAKSAYGLRGREEGELAAAAFVPFTAQTRMSGVDLKHSDGTIRPASARARPRRCCRGYATALHGAVASRRRSARSSTESLPQEERRSSSLKATVTIDACLASSSSRTWSRPACGSGLTSYVAWASAPS